MLSHIVRRIKRLLQGIFPSTKDPGDSVARRVGRMLRGRKTAKTNDLQLSLREYFDLTMTLPLPSAQQRENFADFVAERHSWYKHLSRFQPGDPFQFYLDKYAGYRRVVPAVGQSRFVVIPEGGSQSSGMPTDKYRSRFGYLNFEWTTVGSVNRDLSKGSIVAPKYYPAHIYDDSFKFRRLPSEIAEAAMARLTAVVHTRSGLPGLWHRYYEYIDQLDWPVESGGKVTLEKIFERSRMIEVGSLELSRQLLLTRTTDSDIFRDDHCTPDMPELSPGVDSVLHRLLLPERKRQYREMVRAMDRVCSIVEAHRRS